MGIWTKLLMVAAWALIAYVGHWPPWINVATAVVVAIAVAYLALREQRGFRTEFVRGNLLYLLPGHILLLLGLTLARSADAGLWALWLGLVAATLGFDAAAHAPWPFAVRKRWAMALYALAWGLAFVLIHQIVALGGRLQGGGMLAFSLALAVGGLAYVGLALYRFTQLQPTHD